MNLDISSESTGGAVAYGGVDGVPTTAGNVSLSVDSTDRLYGESAPKDFVLETDNAIPGYLTGRRPAYGHQYPRSEHTPALDLRAYGIEDRSVIPLGITGVIFSAFAYSGVPSSTAWNPNNTSVETYEDNFGQILPYQPNPPLFAYSEVRSAYVEINSGTFNHFNLDWKLLFSASNGNWDGDFCDATIEFLDQTESLIAIIQTDKDGTYRHQVNYGVSFNALSKAVQDGPYPNTSGEITFTDDSIIFTNTKSSNYNNSFTINCPAYLIRKIRVSNVVARSTWWNGVGAGFVYLKIV